MPFIWNDPTYFTRVKENRRYARMYVYPAFVISFLFWFFTMGETIKLENIFLLTVTTAMIFYTLIDLILKFPHPNIPDYYHPYAKTAMRISYFFVSLMLGWYCWATILSPVM